MSRPTTSAPWGCSRGARPARSCGSTRRCSRWRRRPPGCSGHPLDGEEERLDLGPARVGSKRPAVLGVALPPAHHRRVGQHGRDNPAAILEEGRDLPGAQRHEVEHGLVDLGPGERGDLLHRQPAQDHERRRRECDHRHRQTKPHATWCRLGWGCHALSLGACRRNGKVPHPRPRHRNPCRVRRRIVEPR